MNKVNKVSTGVLITGAGPTGLMMACRLAQFNIPLRIIDKKKSPSSFSGAMIVHARTLELFNQMGLAEKMIGLGTKISALNTRFNGKASGRLNLEGKAEGESEFPFILMLEQSKTEQLLIDYLTHRGCKVEWETRLDHFDAGKEPIEADVILPGGEREVVNTNYLVAADGAKSSIRALLEIPFLGQTHDKDLSIMECDADINVPPGEICFSFSKKATTGFFPLPHDKWRIDAAFHKMKVRQEPLTFAEVQNIFNRKTKIPANLRNSDWFSVFHSHGKYASYYQVNRIFLVGDAAHLFTPVGGQGMNTGLQDACNLAWKLAMVIQGKMAPELLITYQEERKPVAISTCRSSDRFFKLAASGKLKYRIFRNYMLPLVIKLFFRLMKNDRFSKFVFRKLSGTGISYSSNYINSDGVSHIYSLAPKPGQRLPFFKHQLHQENGISPEILGDNQFQLLAFGDEENLRKLEKAAKMYNGLIKFIPVPFNSETSGIYLQFGIKAAGWYFIRPDLYIASRSDEYGSEDLKAYLKKIFIR